MSQKAEISVLPAGLGMALAILVACGVVLAGQSSDAKALSECHSKLLGAGSALGNYLDSTTDHLAPKLSTVKGNLAFDDKIASDQSNEPSKSLVQGVYPDGKIDDSALLYLGYMVEDISDVEALSGYYKDKMAKGEPLEDVIPLSKPRRDGRNALLRIQRLGDQPAGSAWSGWYRDPSIIPVFVERADTHGDKGLHVVFLDGHVAFYPSARSSAWPFERREIGPLNEMDALKP